MTSSGTYGDFAWKLGRVYMGIPARIFTRARAYGIERVPLEGGNVVAINHLHWIDIPLLGALWPRTINYVAKIEALRFPLLGRFIRWHGTLGIRRGESDREASKEIERELHRQWAWLRDLHEVGRPVVATPPA